ncbi:peptidoglycan-binding protein [Streptomyces shenzhenensis]|uniref:peptidoglycan-binding protein n=1 Tax=Streptomyces shenzhenensis TaxID=943815 RepID=UPI00217E28F1|nr:peptidoglycan-binding protein [Streptomyces shenzhenensis]
MKRDQRRPSSRTTRLGVIVGAVALVGAGGWIAGTRMESPADAAAAHQPPKAGPVTVPVVQQALTATVVAQGSLEYGSLRSLTLAGPVGASEEGGESGAAAQRVTKVPTRGSVLREGSVLMQVSGRPVLVLRGPVPMYRPIGPGSSGDDVRQLQNALNRLGFATGGVTGTYGQGTASAVSRWYRSEGYAAQEPSTADRQQLGQLESAVSDAQLALLTAQGSGEGTQGDGGSGTESAQARSLQIKSARKQLELANSALSAFRSAYGTKVPAGEVIFLPELPVRVDKTKVRAGDAPDGEVATVTSSDLVVEAVVPDTDAGSLREGMTVRVTTQDGKEAKGVLDEIGGPGTGAEGSAGNAGTGGGAEQAGSSGGGASAPVPLRISIPKPGPLAGAGAGGTATVTIKVGDSDGEVLAVPVAAIQTSADGQARVRVQRGKQSVDVDVDLGISADGLVAVKSKGSGLKEGDLVVVGL